MIEHDQSTFFDEIDIAVAANRGCVVDLNSVHAFTGDAPPVCPNPDGTGWLCPTCHPGGMWSKEKRTGYGNWGGSNILRCNYCGQIVIMRLSIQHTGWRRLVPEVTLRYQALDPRGAYRLECTRARIRQQELRAK